MPPSAGRPAVREDRVAILQFPDGQIQRSGPESDGTSIIGIPQPGISPVEMRVLAVMAAARYHGVQLDRDDLRFPGGHAPEPAALVDWLRNSGLWARGVRMRWRSLIGLKSSAPVVLLLKDGGAALVVRTDPARDRVWTRDPAAEVDTEPTPVDAATMAALWDGETILLRADRGSAYDNEPFSLVWLARLVWQDHKLMGQIFLASLMMTMLTIVAMLLVMGVVNRVVTYHSYNTLAVLSLLLGITLLFERLFRLHSPPADDRCRPACRGPGQPGDVQAHAGPADRFLRAQPGRRDHVPARPYRQGARLPDRPRADHPARRGDTAACCCRCSTSSARR